jgi:hypothetical protein
MVYENLLLEAQASGIDVVSMKFNGNSKGYYAHNTIVLDTKIETTAEKCCVLAEELGHHHTTYGNILNEQTDTFHQETTARNWGYEKLVTLHGLIKGYYHNGCGNRYELADYLDVTEEFLDNALLHYKQKYGLYIEAENHIIYFDPLNVEKIGQSLDPCPKN